MIYFLLGVLAALALCGLALVIFVFTDDDGRALVLETAAGPAYVLLSLPSCERIAVYRSVASVIDGLRLSFDNAARVEMLEWGSAVPLDTRGGWFLVVRLGAKPTS